VTGASDTGGIRAGFPLTVKISRSMSARFNKGFCRVIPTVCSDLSTNHPNSRHNSGVTKVAQWAPGGEAHIAALDEFAIVRDG